MCTITDSRFGSLSLCIASLAYDTEKYPYMVKIYSDEWIKMRGYAISRIVMYLHHLSDNGLDPNEHICLSDLDLSGADFSNVNLKGVDISRCVLSFADFTGADCTGTNFSDSVMCGTIGLHN